MDEREFLKRKIFLKGQALKVIRAERNKMRERFTLLNFREKILMQMRPEFDPELSQRLDCIDYLLKA
jgi:hypothetical protein